MADEEAKGSDLSEYRQHLVLAGQKSQEDYDKTLIALSGGALAISFAFLKDYIGSGPIENICLLLLSWSSWGLSLIVVLASFYFSNLSIREAMKQVDERKIEHEKPGGAYSTVTTSLNLIGGLLFFLGVVFMICFASANLNNRRVDNGKNTRSATEAYATATEAYATTEAPR